MVLISRHICQWLRLECIDSSGRDRMLVYIPLMVNWVLTAPYLYKGMGGGEGTSSMLIWILEMLKFYGAKRGERWDWSAPNKNVQPSDNKCSALVSNMFVSVRKTDSIKEQFYKTSCLSSLFFLRFQRKHDADLCRAKCIKQIFWYLKLSPSVHHSQCHSGLFTICLKEHSVAPSWLKASPWLLRVYPVMPIASVRL